MVASSTPRERRPATPTEMRDELAALRIDRSRDPGGSWLWRFFLFLLVVGALGGAGAAAWWKFKDRLQSPLALQTDTVRVMTVGQATAVLTATGYLESRRQASVGAKGAGRISEMLVEEGAKVQKGDLLAVLEHNDLDAVLESRKVEVDQAEAHLAEAHSQLEQRERDFGREQALRAKGAGTQSALENAETEFHTAQARIKQRMAAVAAAKAHVREAEEALRNMKVYAPFAGTIISRDAELGETIMPGGMGAASGRGSVVTLADLNALEVDTDVKEDYLGQIRRGQPADIVVDAVPDRRYRGHLREIIPMGDRTRGIVKVKVAVDNADDRLFPDLSATVHFLPTADAKSAGDSTPATYVPAGALVEAGKQQFVWRLTGERVERVDVVSNGKPRDGLVPIRGKLAGGEVVVINPPSDLTPETRVQAAP